MRGTHGAAPSAPTPPVSMRTDKFCMNCGTGLIGSAIVCPRCGSGAPHADRSMYAYGTPAKKDKTVALILAIFVGHFAWLYTYDRDQQKFWIGTGIWVGGFLLLFFVVGFFMWIGLWIWVIVDVVQRNDDWYAAYPSVP